MSRVLVRGARLPGTAASVVAVADGRIVHVGHEDSAAAFAGAGEVVDADGALLTAGFTDSHVHTVRTGFALTGLDLTGTTSLDDLLDRVAAHAADRPDAGILLGQGWDETLMTEGRPPTGDELERAAPGRRVQLTRVDSHSAVLSPALASLVPGLSAPAGWTDDGRVERDAHHAARATGEQLISDADRLDAARAACAAMADVGLLGFHENAAPHIGPEAEIPLVRQAAEEAGLRAVVYWGELQGFEAARRLGATGLAGDLIADGAFGSRTAGLAAPYADAPAAEGPGAAAPCGHVYLDATQVADHVVACTEAGLQAGFHAIGDAALDAIAEGLRRAVERLGVRAVRAAGHRLEHVEMPSPDVVAVLDDAGVVSSVQPVFDALWGGPHGMYAARLGGRWRVTNPFAALAATRGGLALGSDSPVTPVGPWAAVRAAVHHHEPSARIDPMTAYRAHTEGSARAGRDTGPGGGGRLEVGARADLALWDCPAGLDAARPDDHLPVLDPGADLPVLRRSWGAGRTVRGDR